MTKLNKGLFTSNSNEWATPQKLFDELNSEFNFNLDVCATSENTKCMDYFTKEDDGLNKEWHGTCFMNPPYSTEISKWVKKAYEEALKGNLVVGLLPARTDTRWYWNYVVNKAEIRFIKGRLKFNDQKGSAPFPSMIVIWKPSCYKRISEELVLSKIGRAIDGLDADGLVYLYNQLVDEPTIKVDDDGNYYYKKDFQLTSEKQGELFN